VPAQDNFGLKTGKKRWQKGKRKLCVDLENYEDTQNGTDKTQQNGQNDDKSD
jgi:hypothetical protein